MIGVADHDTWGRSNRDPLHTPEEGARACESENLEEELRVLHASIPKDDPANSGTFIYPRVSVDDQGSGPPLSVEYPVSTEPLKVGVFYSEPAESSEFYSLPYLFAWGA